MDLSSSFLNPKDKDILVHVKLVIVLSIILIVLVKTFCFVLKQLCFKKIKGFNSVITFIGRKTKNLTASLKNSNMPNVTSEPRH